MTNEEKAIQVATDSQGHIQSFAHMSALEMALWKDEQFAEQKQALIDKACEWLTYSQYRKDNIVKYLDDNFINEFKKAMED